jgi:hypothetical protein
MKNSVFWDMAPCRSYVNRRFGGTYRLHLKDRKIRVRRTSVSRWLQSAAGSSHADFSTLKMEAIRSSETLVHTRYTLRHIPEDGILNAIYFYLLHFIEECVLRRDATSFSVREG